MQAKQVANSTRVIGTILTSIIVVEGVYSNDPYDPGQETKYGITEKVARDYGYQGKMVDLTKEQANEIYTHLYIQKPGLDQLVDINPAISHKLIDAGVNVGPARAIKWFQQSLNALSGNGTHFPLLKEDGVLGSKTIQAYLKMEEVRGSETTCILVLKALDSYQGAYYLSLKQHFRYTAGWLNKRVQNIPLDQCKQYNLSNKYVE